MIKILVSACLYGEKVRYDGQANLLTHPLFSHWQQQGRLVPFCPECAGGLSTPRPPAELSPDQTQVFTISGSDVSNAFTQGAKKALELCQQEDIQYAILKESSPSCGSENIYDGSFTGKKIKGQGVTSKLLSAHGIKVYSEHNFMDIAKQLID